MITGTVSPEGTPVIAVPVAGQNWRAVIDAGFNGDVELPDTLRSQVNPRFKTRVLSILAGGQSVMEDLYQVDFPFDGQMVVAEASFVPGASILIGTHLLQSYRLEIDFPNSHVQLDRLI